jgi:hypothetical protein
LIGSTLNSAVLNTRTFVIARSSDRWLGRRTSFEEVSDYESGDVAVIVPSAATVVTEIVGQIEFASFRRNFLFDLDCCALLATVRTVEAWEVSFFRVWRDEGSRFIPP